MGAIIIAMILFSLLASAWSYICFHLGEMNENQKWLDGTKTLN